MGRSLTESLRASLSCCDGRATTLLGEVEAALGKDPAYRDALIALAGDPDDTIAASTTWLIKASLEEGGALDSSHTRTLIETLPNVAAWAAQLHLCQSIRYLEVPAESAEFVADWLHPLLAHARPFVRAWSLDALASLSTAHRGLGDRFAAALAAGELDEAASVRARARTLRAAL